MDGLFVDGLFVICGCFGFLLFVIYGYLLFVICYLWMGYLWMGYLWMGYLLFVDVLVFCYLLFIVICYLLYVICGWVICGWVICYRDGFSYFRSGGVDKYLGGCCCLLWPGRGGNAWKGQGKSLTKFVF